MKSKSRAASSAWNLLGRTCFFAAVAATLAWVGCKEKPEVKEYDRAALLMNIGSNQVLLGYDNLWLGSMQLTTDCRAFRRQPGLATLDALQAKFYDTWLLWKACSPFEFGPAATISLRSVLNTYPGDTSQIHNNFMAGTWDLNLASNLDARGFPALDFMLHGLGVDDIAILQRYQSPTDSTKLQDYLEAIVTDIEANVTTVRGQWDTGHLNTFTQSLGTDVGSSTSMLVNELNRDLEIIKTAAVGIPLGKQTFDQPLPEKVEGLYSAWSLHLIQAELLALQAIFEGEANGAAQGYGLREALDAVEAEYNGGSLGDAIHSQFEATQTALFALPSTMQESVIHHRPQVEALYTEIQKLVVLLKTDMASALSILITYTDADGD